MGFVVDKGALEQLFSPALRFSPVSFIPPVLRLLGKTEKLTIFITELHSKNQGCGATVESAAGPFTATKSIWSCLVKRTPEKMTA
jgi:hypothetical protein